MEELEIDLMLLADGAHSVGGKIYILGGGWTHLWFRELPGRPAPFALAIGLKVPWNLTNRRFNFRLELVDADGNNIEESAMGEFEQGRPPGLRPGTSQRMLVAVPVAPEIPSPGRFVFHAIVDGQRLASTEFEVVLQPQPQSAKPPQDSD
jgi:hypothetical protein